MYYSIAIRPRPAELFRLLSSLMLARHGNAPKVDGVSDREKMLSDKGREQAGRLRSALIHQRFDFIGASPLSRAYQTTRLMTSGSASTIKTIRALDLNDKSDDPLTAMFGELMYSPLSEYFRHENADCLKDWAFEALYEIMEEVRKVRREQARVFIGGHAVCQPAIAWAIGEIIAQSGEISGKRLREAMLEINLGEAEVIALDFADHTHTVSYLLLKP